MTFHGHTVGSRGAEIKCSFFHPSVPCSPCAHPCSSHDLFVGISACPGDVERCYVSLRPWPLISFSHPWIHALLVCACVPSHVSRVWLFATLRTVACQAALSMGFSRQEYWSVLPFPFPGELPDLQIELTSPTSPALASGFFTTTTTSEAIMCGYEKWKQRPIPQ